MEAKRAEIQRQNWRTDAIGAIDDTVCVRIMEIGVRSNAADEYFHVSAVVRIDGYGRAALTERHPGAVRVVGSGSKRRPIISVKQMTIGNCNAVELRVVKPYAVLDTIRTRITLIASPWAGISHLQVLAVEVDTPHITTRIVVRDVAPMNSVGGRSASIGIVVRAAGHEITIGADDVRVGDLTRLSGQLEGDIRSSATEAPETVGEEESVIVIQGAKNDVGSRDVQISENVIGRYDAAWASQRECYSDRAIGAQQNIRQGERAAIIHPVAGAIAGGKKISDRRVGRQRGDGDRAGWRAVGFPELLSVQAVCGHEKEARAGGDHHLRGGVAGGRADVFDEGSAAGCSIRAPELAAGGAVGTVGRGEVEVAAHGRAHGRV